MILLQGNALTLTFKVATQMLRATRHLNMVIIYLWNSFKIWLQITKLYGPSMILLQGDAVTLILKVVTQMLRATRGLNMVIISVK